MTAIEEAKDLNTLSVEDLISSLKCHEIGLNEHESIKKHKSIALKSRGKSSKALKALESEEESTSEDSEEDPEIVQKMAMLSNKLQYLAKKNKKFLSRSSSHKSSRREEKRKVASTARKLDTSLLNVQTCRKKNPKKNPRSQSSNPTNSRSKSRRA